jgi:glucose-6-phosphate-specific signal transduction histidine kinase
MKVQKGLPVDYRNTYIPHFALLFTVHLWALLTNKPEIISFALWIVVVSLFSTVVSWVFGWSALTINGAIGVFIGASLVAYTIVKSSSAPMKA